MGADHATIFATQVPGVSLRYICDADAARAKSVANATGAAHVETDPLAVINSREVDAIVIASPDQTHGPLSIACIKAGKPVLCEKPLSPSVAECLEIIDYEVKSGKRLVQVGFMRRFDASYIAMRNALEQGTLGDALMMHNFHRNVSAPSNFSGQMAITNSAPHEFDIARFVLGTDFAEISVFQPQNMDASKPGAPVFMVARTVSGQLVNIEVNNNAAYGYDVRGELVGDKGSVSLRAPVHSELNVSLAQSTAYAADWRPRFAEAYRLQNMAWIKSIHTGIPAGASAWDGYCATLVADAGVAALASGRPEKVTPVAKPALYD